VILVRVYSDGELIFVCIAAAAPKVQVPAAP
jgi:hypothetical protein